ncbi:RNA helicase [Plasmodium ovale wallikeri]|uniref:ATP-dependent RNA helicase n=1 Tax=Plasmodium ovale wallikeri TaxID=864142 RepID=A0A1A8ZNK4_PLAOA|nr:RNA helicase [Plasmodium ovale wallikeri]SBT46249.1 RNA helicase [Plasmodium ovale wallikeri]
MNMTDSKGKFNQNKKIFNKNYGNKIKKKKKGYEGRKGFGYRNNIDERDQLQREIDEKLGLLVEENKRKQYEEQWKKNLEKNENNDIEKGGKKEDEKRQDVKDDKNSRYKNNLTIIDKNVLTENEFSNLPISKRTLRALNENNFVHMTNIQAVSIPIVLLNKHIYAQAQTGTGKTLCFCVPLVEKMYRNNIDSYNKILGGLIITPTRELVFQIFEVLNMLNKYHKLNICCAIGGKDEEREKSIFSYANIIVCTTGRLLYHLENNYYCNLDYLSTLVIDEIDKLIDKSFYDNLKSILLYKPKENCQICLFSATICKFLSIILKTFNIKDYEYVSINDNDKYIESNNVKQIYIECSIYDKINYLYTFLFSKKNKKIIVFFSTCKQVRFMFEVFKKIKVGVMKFLQLHGKLKQTSRLNTYHFFSKKNNFVCLFTTDIACRGLDFASVDWVIHFDFPENVETFIHRSGRTGRFTNVGNSLIFLTKDIDNKKIFLKVLQENNIEIKEKFIKKQKLFDINNKIHSLNAAFVEIKYLAKKALIIYLRHLYIIMKFRDIKKIDLNQLAYSYGLIEFSSSMMEELNLMDETKVQVKKKRSRFEKYLEILKNKKLEKKIKQGGTANEEGGKAEEGATKGEETVENSRGGEEHEEDSMKDDDTPSCHGCDDVYLKEDKNKIHLNDYIQNDTSGKVHSSILDVKESDDLFVQRSVEIEDDKGPILLPTKKRRKRIRVTKTLQNSTLYDENGNEITDDNTKFKILVNEINGDKKGGRRSRGNASSEGSEEGECEEDREDEENDDSCNFDGSAYIETLKEKIEKDNEQIKISKLRKRERDALDKIDDSSISADNSNTEENAPFDQNGESTCFSNDHSSSENFGELTSSHFVKSKRKEKLLENGGKMKIRQDENTNEDISDLENKVMMFL